VRAGGLPAHQAATWAWAGKAAPRLGLKWPVRSRIDRDCPIKIDGRASIPADQNRPRAPLRNPSSLSSPSPSPAPPPASPLPLRDCDRGDRGDGAAAGLLAGVRARLCVARRRRVGPRWLACPRARHGGIHERRLRMPRSIRGRWSAGAPGPRRCFPVEQGSPGGEVRGLSCPWLGLGLGLGFGFARDALMLSPRRV
jgi:hypothetical protein